MTVPVPLASGPDGPPLLRAEDLRKVYPLRRGLLGASAGQLRAVDGISFEIRRGETLGLVGESGSGKSTTGRMLLRLEEPTSGRILLEGEDWLALRGAALRRRRGEVQIVFQDPKGSLNPRLTVGDQIAEPMRVQGLARGATLRARTAALLDDVGLSPGAGESLPSELSGGQRQRVAIARALATDPKLLVCDEPVSSLDVSVGAQILNLLLQLRERRRLSTLFISHDLAVVSRMADRIAVLYAGRIVEEGPATDVLRRPLHPYTAAMLSAAPGSAGPRIVLAGDPRTRIAPEPGCFFAPRCPIARPRCREDPPELVSQSPAHSAACFFPGELRPPG